MSQANRRWTEQEVARCVELYEQGLDYYQICRELANGRSVAAIESKVRKEMGK